MRVLQLSARNIWPLNTGAKLREFYLAREVARQFPLTYAGFWDDAERPPGGGACPALEMLPGADDVVMVPKPERYTLVKLLRGLFGPPVTILNYTTATMTKTVDRLLASGRFGAVQIEGVHAAGYLPAIAARGALPVVCDWHNIESELLRRYSEHAAGLGRRLYAWRTAAVLERYEQRLAASCQAHIVVSRRDGARVLAWAPGADVRIVENGVDTAYFEATAASLPAARRRILFVGSMDYHANIDGAVWFAREVWPLLRERIPGAVLTIAGRNPAPAVAALASQPGVEVTGTVADVRPYYAEALAAVVPLRIGSGTRLKIPEAMAAGVPVVSTRLGAEGLDVTPGSDILLGDSPVELADAVAAVAMNRELAGSLAEAGLRLARERYDWSRVARPLLEIFSGFGERARAEVAG